MAIEAQYKTANGRLVFKVAADSVKEVFGQVADLASVFEAEQQCGMCSSKNIGYSHRVVSKGKQKFDYYELICGGCFARFRFGQLSDGSNGLFPKRKDTDGKYLANHGWGKYQAGGHADEDADPDDPNNY